MSVNNVTPQYPSRKWNVIFYGTMAALVLDALGIAALLITGR